jgi:hypothetical protein
VYSLLLSFFLFSNFADAKIRRTECLERDFSDHFGKTLLQDSTETTCWAFAGTKLFEEEVCLNSGGKNCGLTLSVADSMRCDFTTRPSYAGKAIHCALAQGICEEADAPYPHEGSYNEFENLWQSLQCSAHRVSSVGRTHLVVRDNSGTSDEELGLKPGDDIVRGGDLSQAVLQALGEGRSPTISYLATGSSDPVPHAIVISGMRWNSTENWCELQIINSQPLFSPYNGWGTPVEYLMSKAYRVSWISNQ